MEARREQEALTMQVCLLTWLHLPSYKLSVFANVTLSVFAALLV